jgi:hypothetical protein
MDAVLSSLGVDLCMSITLSGITVTETVFFFSGASFFGLERLGSVSTVKILVESKILASVWYNDT